MFEDTVVVQSAVSAFNNAALVAPAFLWWAILMLPLFAMVYLYGNDFIARIGWTRQNMLSRMCLTTVAMILCWVVVFGGNYAVLRDRITVLPFLVALIVFLSTVFVASHTQQVKLPKWRGAPRRKRVRIAAFVAMVLLIVGLSDTHTWWGPMLQIVAFCAGCVVGRRARTEMRPVPGVTMIVMATMVAMLMQPEFFRFGQLGALSPFHLLFLLAGGVVAAALTVLRNVNVRGRVHRSAYIKLKWMARFVAALGIVLFVMTESVPVFLGTVAVFGASFALSVWHASKVPENLDNAAFAIMLMIFGTITVMPVITAMGLVWFMNLEHRPTWRDARFLL